jgi:hypothetical protein
MGGTAHLHRLDEFLAGRTGLRVVRLALPPAEMGAALVAGGDPVVFAPAIALAVRGSMRARTRMNFRQDELARRIDLRKLGRELRWTAGLAGLAVLLRTSPSSRAGPSSSSSRRPGSTRRPSREDRLPRTFSPP